MTAVLHPSSYSHRSGWLAQDLEALVIEYSGRRRIGVGGSVAPVAQGTAQIDLVFPIFWEVTQEIPPIGNGFIKCGSGALRRAVFQPHHPEVVMTGGDQGMST